MLMEYWAEDKAAKMENESVSKEYNAIQKDIGRVNGPKFYKKHLLNSVNESLGRKDLESISNMHKYFDYSMFYLGYCICLLSYYFYFNLRF